MLGKQKLEMNGEGINSVYLLPDELIFYILSFLPSKSLLRFRSVCKSWNAIITHDIGFRNLHLCNSNSVVGGRRRCRWLSLCLEGPLNGVEVNYIYDETFTSQSLEPCPFPCHEMKGLNSSYTYVVVVGSCKGLICIMCPSITLNPETSDFTLCLWNPSIKKYKEIPFSFPKSYSIAMLVGFGFVENHKRNNNNNNNNTRGYLDLSGGSNKYDYKIVIVCQESYTKEYHVYVYTLSTNSCTQDRFKPSALMRPIYFYKGTYFNGAYHWTCIMGVATERVNLLWFDMDDENFGYIDIPAVAACKDCPRGQNCQTLIYKDMLAVWDSCSHMNSSSAQKTKLWVMNEYGNSGSWTSLLTVVVNNDIPHFSSNIKFMLGTVTDGDKLVYTSLDRSLMAYDLQTQELLKLEPTYIVHLVPYQESLIALDHKDFTSEEDSQRIIFYL